MFKFGDITLHSGQKSWWKIELDYLSTDIDQRYLLAEQLYLISQPFSLAVGVPTGGLELAHELNCFPRDPHAPVLIVDDVYTTGDSMNKIVEAIGGSGLAWKGAVAFTRNGKLPDNVKALLYVKEVGFP